MPASYRFIVSGQVQGVGFRYSALERAQKLGLTGWVRNCADGTVEGLACGAAAALEKFSEWLRQGPPAARVKNVEWLAAADTAPESFEVRR